MCQTAKKPVEGPKNTVSDWLTADTEIDEAVTQQIGDHFANRPVLTVKAKTGQRTGLAELYYVAVLERLRGGANAVHPHGPTLDSLDSISIFSAVKACDQVLS
jgi:hypothetical protein